MSLIDDIYAVWDNSPYPPPTYALVRVGEDYMVVIDDNSSILRFMDVEGHVYSVVGTHCNVDPSKVYECTNIQMILCSPSSEVDRFVEENILPLVKSYDTESI